MRIVLIVLALIGLAFVITTFANNSDTAVDKIEYNVKEAADEVGDAAENAADKVEDAVN